MAKFATRNQSTVKGLSPITSDAPTTNHAGLPAHSRTAKSDLFLLGVTNFVSEDTYYESGEDRDSRFASLVRTVTLEDPEWVANFIAYLRNTANMRSAAVVAACEYVAAGGPNGRRVVASACLRADEPAEVLAYWRGTRGRSIPAAVKRGVADAAQRLYNERSYIKYDSKNSNWRFADILQLAHVKPKDVKQDILFKTILNDRYEGSADFPYEALPVLGQYRAFTKMDKDLARKDLIKRPEALKNAGMTWESFSSFGPMDKDAWEAVIPSMGYMALLRNLRNFDQAGVSDKVADYVVNKLQDPEEVARSRQLPFRFYSAYKNVPSLRWSNALERALDYSLSSIPSFKGRTLVLVDTSGSMSTNGWSSKSTSTPVETAALFGAALAKSGQDVDLMMFANHATEHKFPAGGSTLKVMNSLVDRVGEVGHGTNIPDALRQWDGHDRIILLSDMQTTSYFSDSDVPDNVPLYAFNLEGYASTVVNTNSNRLVYEFGGLTDGTFSMINAIEDARSATWPWDK